MRILLITATWHPALNPNVYRWSSVAEHWTAQGHSVHVLCTRRRGVSDEAVMNGVSVHRAGQNTLLDWVYNVLGVRKRRGEAGIGSGAHRRRRLWREALEKLLDLSWRSIYWPDGRCLWYFPGRRRLRRLLREEPFDVLISVGLPFTAHLLGLVAKKEQPGLRWHVDIEDPFSFSKEFFVNNFRLYGRLNYRAESRVLKMADSVSVTVEKARRRYVEAFPEVEGKIRVIPPLFDLPLADVAPEKFDSGNIHLGYFGVFYHGVRTPDAFLELLDAAFRYSSELQSKLQVHFFGEIDSSFFGSFRRYPGLEDKLRFHGLVTRERVAAAIKGMDLLLNIGNTTDYHLPSKSVDYLMSGKPVVNISAAGEDPFAWLFRAYPLILTLRPQAGDISAEEVERFVTFILKNCDRTVDPGMVEELGRPYRLEVIAGAYEGEGREGNRKTEKM